MLKKNYFSHLAAAAGLLGLLAIATQAFAASQEQVLYSFCKTSGCPDGDAPAAGLVSDAAGNFYGTTYGGGQYNFGTVFQLTPNGNGTWTHTLLYSFGGYPEDSASPYAGLIFDSKGNLYGTTYNGGVFNGGTAFELSPGKKGAWTEQVLYSFGKDDAYFPMAGLIFDANGNLYGTAAFDVFELSPHRDGTRTEKSLCTVDGLSQAALVMDASGNLYGTTVNGGSKSWGSVFECSRGKKGNWTATVLHSFKGKDGRHPEAGLIFDANGNLYGTTFKGGAGYPGAGVVFELSPGTNGKWTEKILHTFQGGQDGAGPAAGLIFDASGNLYGTTWAGGSNYDAGTVFELSPGANGTWTETVLHSFGGGTDGTEPIAPLILDGSGNLYGTTSLGGAYHNCDEGNACGTVFEVTP